VNTIADIILILAVLGLIAGLVKPRLYIRFIKDGKFMRRKLSLVFGLAIIVALIMLVNGTPTNASLKGSAVYTATLQSGVSLTRPASGYGTDGWSDTGSVAIVNPATLRVYVEVKNTGKADGKPECTVQARDDNSTYTGTDVVTKNAALQPGGVWDFDDALTITRQGAQYVTQVSVDCK
jgi:hypothetical protein